MQHHDYAVLEKMNRMMREANNERLVNQVQHNHPKPNLVKPVLARLGKEMVNLGQRLQESVEAPGSLATES